VGFLSYVAEALLMRTSGVREDLEGYLARFGWGLAGTNVVPLTIIDSSELAEISDAPRRDLIKAAIRLRDGDLSGAISAACGAVDACTASIYQRHSLGDPGSASFQEKCSRALKAKGFADALESELRNIGWDEKHVGVLRQNFVGSLNQGAYVLQSLRANMGDVHGSKPILKPLVLDCIRWAELLVRTLETADEAA
jgi:hypothetical protein